MQRILGSAGLVLILVSSVASADGDVTPAQAVEYGRQAFLAGRMPRRAYASASSPLDGTFFA